MEPTPANPCSVKLYGTNPTTTMSTGLAEIHVTRKYQLLRQSLQGVETVIEEVTPEWHALFEIPLHLLPSRALRELHVTNALRYSGLDPGLSNFLRPWMASFAADLALRFGFRGFHMVVHVEVGTEEWVNEENGFQWLLDESMGMGDGDFVRNGASGSAIEKLMKEGIFDGGDHADLGTCMVCLEEFLGGTQVTIKMPCSHLFHRPCIARWLEQSNSCPICRFELVH